MPKRTRSTVAFPGDAEIPAAVSAIMRSIRSSDTKPELVVRRLLHRLGFRFRLHDKKLPGTPDIVLPRHRAAIFVHGCFWHHHSGCKHAKIPRKRETYWIPKLARTQQRDRNALAALSKEGWRTLVVWECSTANQEALARDLIAFLEGAFERR